MHALGPEKTLSIRHHPLHFLPLDHQEEAGLPGLVLFFHFTCYIHTLNVMLQMEDEMGVVEGKSG